MIAHISAIFLLPVFEKSVIFDDFRGIVHRVSAREGGDTVCWKAMFRHRTDDDSMTYWFRWKHPMARRQGVEFDVSDQTPRKWARRCCPTGLATRSFFRHKTTTAKASARPFGLRHSSLSAPLHKTRPKCGLGPVGLALGTSQMQQAPIFRPFDVHLAVSDVLRSTRPR